MESPALLLGSAPSGAVSVKRLAGVPSTKKLYMADGAIWSEITANAYALQGNGVKVAAPSDGDLLTWVAANNDWEPKAPGGGGGISLTSGTPIYRASTRNSTNSGWTNFTIWARFNAAQLSCWPTTFKAVISVLGGTGISIAKAALIITPIQSTTISSNIPIKFGGATSLVTALSPPVNVVTDAISVTFDLLHDYYLMMYLDTNAFNGGVGLMCGDASWADPPSANWGGGDSLTGIAAAPAVGAHGWTGWWTLVIA